MSVRNEKNAICTISSHNYMSYVLTCILSAKLHNPECDFFYLVVDELDTKLYTSFCDDINFLDLYSIGIDSESIVNMAYKYNIVEFNTAVNPAFYSYIFKIGYESVICLGPDIECFSTFDSFFEENKKNSIIVTPHKTSAISSPLIDDSVFLNNGIYNLGFIALNKSDSTMCFLNWWDEKLKNQCFIDYSIGLATDQIWVELASTIFAGFKVAKNLGLNAAFWNVHERRIQKDGDTWYAGKDKLVFFYFSSLSEKCNIELLSNIERINPGFKTFYSEHNDRVKQYKDKDFENCEYSFLRYSDGDFIQKEERWLFGFSPNLQKNINPFATDERSFYKEVLLSKKVAVKKLTGSQNLIRIVIKIFGVKRALRLLGKASTNGIRRCSELY